MTDPSAKPQIATLAEMDAEMNRLTDNDRHLGPITYAQVSWNPWCLVWSSGDEEYPGNHLTAYAFGWAAAIPLPNILRPAGYDARKYGFSVCDGMVLVYYGAQTHDSSTEQSWSWFIPWKQWRFIRTTFYDDKGEHFWTQYAADRRTLAAFDEQWQAQKKCPTVSFSIIDHDGERITATTRIEEREWHFGKGWWKWLSLFRRPKIVRALYIDFSSEVGPEKGSWKGGMTGHGIAMLPGETHFQAFVRYCAQEKRAKSRRYRIRLEEVVK